MEDSHDKGVQNNIVLKTDTIEIDSEYDEFSGESYISEDEAVHEEFTTVPDKNMVTIYNCSSCNMVFRSVDEHIMDYHNQDEIQIEIDESSSPASNYGFTEIVEEKAFDSTVLPGSDQSSCFKCHVCNTLLKSARSLKLHLKMHEGKPIDKIVERENHCIQCNRVFSSKEHLQLHLKAHDDEPKHQTKSEVDSVPKDSAENGYPCSYCGKLFKRPHEKVKHERIHTGERPYSCEICDKRFRVSSCLSIHRRTHESTRPYVCSHCKKRFKVQSAYNHHLKTHSSERHYQCTFCPKTFKTAVQLSGHKKSHTKPFACSECNRPFGSLYAVRKHMQVHERVDNKLSYSCEVCGANYARISALRDHQKEHHPEDIKSDPEQHTTESDGTIIEKCIEVTTEEIIGENFSGSLHQ